MQDNANTIPRSRNFLRALIISAGALSVLTPTGVAASESTPALPQGSQAAAFKASAEYPNEIDLADVTNIAHADQIARLYRAALGRNADAEGHRFWTDATRGGADVTAIARQMLTSDEATRKSTGDPVINAYRWALGREPDAGGYKHWSSVDPAVAVVAISNSAEHRDLTGTAAPPLAVHRAGEASAPAHPAGWVDAGHGVFVPPILIQIRFCESRHDYQAANPNSSARGAYQFLTGSWASYGHAKRFGVSRAHHATNAQQDQAALHTWQQHGTSPWNASRHCWS